MCFRERKTNDVYKVSYCTLDVIVIMEVETVILYLQMTDEPYSLEYQHPSTKMKKSFHCFGNENAYLKIPTFIIFYLKEPTWNFLFHQ